MNIRPLAAVIFMISATASHAESTDWQRYVTPQSGAGIDLPTGIFSLEVSGLEPAFGQRLKTSNGRANLTVQAFPNTNNFSPAAFLANQRPPAGIIYRKVTPRYFAVSSVREGKIWYNRCNTNGRFMNCVLINYPVGEKRRWDAMVTRISNTLSSKR